MLKNGLVQVYTGDTDLFNFAPIGLCLRAAGQSLSSLITCFLPQELMKGTAIASSFLTPYFNVDNSAAAPSPVNRQSSKEKVLASFQRARHAAVKADFDIIVLNDIHTILGQGIIQLDDLISLIQEKASTVELILTGRHAPKEIIDVADLVTEMVVSSSKGYETTPLVDVITGDGKGKSTYCFGKSILNACLGHRTLIVQFIKSPQPYGEVLAIQKIPNINIKTMGEGFIFSHDPEGKKKHIEAAQQAWRSCVEEILSQKYEMVVLDEINIATHYDLISWEQVDDLLAGKSRNLHLLLSGRNAHPEAVKTATTLIEMKEIKHPFKKGVKARKGIEF